MTLFKDVNGNLSSKRVAGVILMGISVALGVIGSIIGNAMMVDYSKWIVITGAASIVAGVAERKA